MEHLQKRFVVGPPPPRDVTLQTRAEDRKGENIKVRMVSRHRGLGLSGTA